MVGVSDDLPAEPSVAVAAIGAFLDEEKAFARLAQTVGDGVSHERARAEVLARARAAAGEAAKDPEWKPNARARAMAAMAMFTAESPDGGLPMLKILITKQDLLDARQLIEKGGEANFRYTDRYLREAVEGVDSRPYRKGDKRLASAAARVLADHANAVTNEFDGVRGVEALDRRFEDMTASAPILFAYIDDGIVRKNAEASTAPEKSRESLVAAVHRTRDVTCSITINKLRAVLGEAGLGAGS